MYASTRRSRFAIALAILLALPAGAQQKLLIVHADDLGMAHSIDMASIKALESGLVTSASIMVPCPWFPEIAAWARKHPDADLGLHLTLTSEWKSYRWRPLLGLASLVGPDGFFYSTESEAAKRIDPREAEAEVRAQIARARAAGIRPTHLDTHMGTLYQTKELFDMLVRVARDEKTPARITRSRLDTADARLNHVITISAEVPPAKWKEWYTEQIRNVKPGVTEVVVHLAYDDDEMRAITAGHPYWGAAWRQRDFNFFTSEEFRRLLRENNIQLTTWRALR